MPAFIFEVHIVSLRMKRRRVEEGEGVDKSGGGLAPDAVIDSDRDVNGTAWLLDDPNLLELILDHCLPIQPSVLPVSVCFNLHLLLF